MVVTMYGFFEIVLMNLILLRDTLLQYMNFYCTWQIIKQIGEALYVHNTGQ